MYCYFSPRCQNGPITVVYRDRFCQGLDDTADSDTEKLYYIIIILFIILLIYSLDPLGSWSLIYFEIHSFKFVMRGLLSTCKCIYLFIWCMREGSILVWKRYGFGLERYCYDICSFPITSAECSVSPCNVPHQISMITQQMAGHFSSSILIHNLLKKNVSYFVKIRFCNI